MDMGKLEQQLAAHFPLPTEQEARVNKMLDMHSMSAALMFGVAYSDVTKKQRQTAKSLTFPAAYTPRFVYSVPAAELLMSIYSVDEKESLARDMGVPLTELYTAIKARFEGAKH